MELKTRNDYKQLIIDKIPLIDVRAPLEFEKGSMPHAVNIPIMDDEQRRLIGIKYKNAGNEKATLLGYELVSGLDKEEKIKAWSQQFEKHPDTVIFCARGGQRSRISQEWIQETLGREVLRVEGGFKSLRNYLLDAFDPKNQSFTPVRLGGRTGSGKTPIIHQLKHSIDLEGLANHRGSSFGNYIEPQPTQINFENALASDLIIKQDLAYSHLVFEDEGRHIGRCFIPQIFSDHYTQSDLVVVEVPFEQRALNILEEYVKNSQQDYIKTFGYDDGLNKWHEYITISITKAKKRLGGLRYHTFMDMVTTAHHHQLAGGDHKKHLHWIEDFLRDYYDPMYNYQLEKNNKHLVFTGNTIEVTDYLNSLLM